MISYDEENKLEIYVFRTSASVLVGRVNAELGLDVDAIEQGADLVQGKFKKAVLNRDARFTKITGNLLVTVQKLAV